LNWTALISLKITIRKNKQIQLSKQNMWKKDLAQKIYFK
jgi:hypothetical protein